MKFLVAQIALIACCLTLSNCGGGGGSDNSPPTVRPKTLDGLTLILDTNVYFEFIRNTGSAPALESGDVETGTFLYTLGGVQMRQYDNFGGDQSDTRYPDLMSNASYSYRAVNASSGTLTLNGIGVNDLILTGSFNANNGSFTYLFNRDSDGNVVNQVDVDLTFSSAGSVIDSGVATVSIPGSTAPNYDNVRIPTTITISNGGGGVPENYNPIIDPLRPSKIAPESLGGLQFIFTDGTPDPTKDFTIQFVADVNGLPGSDIDEVGQGLLRIAGAVVDDAIDYSWTRIDGTDDGTLVISGSGGMDGSMTLSFDGTDNGTYTGVVSGTFSIIP